MRIASIISCNSAEHDNMMMGSVGDRARMDFSRPRAFSSVSSRGVCQSIRSMSGRGRSFKLPISFPASVNAFTLKRSTRMS